MYFAIILGLHVLSFLFQDEIQTLYIFVLLECVGIIAVKAMSVSPTDQDTAVQELSATTTA